VDAIARNAWALLALWAGRGLCGLAVVSVGWPWSRGLAVASVARLPRIQSERTAE
jgi:hypothetical protein